MRAVLCLSLPLTLWLAGFSGLYALHGLFCSSRWVEGSVVLWQRPVLIGVGVLLIGAQLILAVALQSERWHPEDRTLRRVSLLLSLAAMGSTVWILLPLVLVSGCR
ncbi:hypothetical protein KO491_08965 [Roseovarius nubinhibens]|uniref:hypothetical protein n=1 Tax=Roseovarius nubinhibens TaxID=314263 RepID=UPI001C09B919|nr:hypothetical protein [Roseovarius nubinhibens]MBU2999969.1 hypothetical protein [Roseovarius nubinhibens]